MNPREIKLLIAGLGKLQGDLFDKAESTDLRLQILRLQEELMKAAQHDDHILDFTITVVPDGKGGPDGHELGDRISHALASEWIPHLNDSESGQAFVYFNQCHMKKVIGLLLKADVGVFTFFPTQNPFYKEISNWPKAAEFWNEHTMYSMHSG